MVEHYPDKIGVGSSILPSPTKIYLLEYKLMDLSQNFRETVRLVHKNPRFLALVVGVSLIGVALNFLPGAKVFSFVFSLILIGWFGAKFELLNQLATNKPIDWKQIPRLIWVYFKKLFFPTLILTILLGLAIILLIVPFASWFFQHFTSETMSSSQRIEYLVQAFQSPQVWTAFARQHFFFLIGILAFYLLFGVGMVIGQVVVATMTIDQLSVMSGIKKTASFLRRRVDIFITYILLSLGIALLNAFLHGFIRTLFSGVHLEQLSIFVMAGVSTYIALWLEAFIVLTIIHEQNRQRWQLKALMSKLPQLLKR